MKEHLRIMFMSFWPNFNIHDNIFTNFLKYYYDLEVVTNLNEKVDLIIYSCFYHSLDEKNFLKHTKYKKLYYSGENDFPDFNIADYAMTQNRFQFENRHMYCPLWFREHLNCNEDGELYFDIDMNGSTDKNLVNREFCSFVVSNNNCAIPVRTKIYEEISKYKHIASGGRYLNNIGGPVENKHEFISKYKFNIASENSLVNGYITEKITDAFKAQTIPIYIGPSDIITEFNPKSFINVNDFNSFDTLIDKIKELDEDDEKYMEMISEPKLNPYILKSFYSNFKSFILCVVRGPKYNHKYGRIGLLNQ